MAEFLERLRGDVKLIFYLSHFRLPNIWHRVVGKRAVNQLRRFTKYVTLVFQPRDIGIISRIKFGGNLQQSVHQFHLRTRLLGAIVTLEAYELKENEPSGYQFQLIGEPDEDRFVQLGRLVDRIRRALATQYLEDGRAGFQIKGMQVKGAIEADMSDEGDLWGSRMPMLVIDGRDVSWEDFGRMLMTFEGFQFKLEIVDKSDDLAS